MMHKHVEQHLKSQIAQKQKVIEEQKVKDISQDNIILKQISKIHTSEL